ncbi:MAG: diguanylate cyclase [Rhodopirellula sp.]|nr:diguanylate cyclase [Rhodopirellula sp.]
MAEFWELIGGAGYTTAVFALGRLSSNIGWSTLFDSDSTKASAVDDSTVSCDSLLSEIRQELNSHSASTRRLNEQLDTHDHDLICNQAKATRTDNSQFQKFLDDRCSELERHPESSGGEVKKLLGNLAGHRQRANELDDVLAKFEDPEQIESAISPLRDCIRDLEDHNKRLQSELEETRKAVAQQSQKLERAKEEARVDALTGLPNRRAFDERIEQTHLEFTRNGSPYAVALLDVDHFKKFNDEHGHAIGDKVLEVVGEVLRRTQRGTDHISRYGGEEFVVLLERLPGQQAKSVVDRQRSRIGKSSLRVNGKDLKITVSAGVAEVKPGESIASVMTRADEALYAAKAAGRNQTCLDDGTTIVDMENLSLNGELVQA